MPVSSVLPFPPEEVFLESPQGMRTPPTQIAEGSGAEMAEAGRSSTQPLREQKPSNNTTKKVGEEPGF